VVYRTGKKEKRRGKRFCRKRGLGLLLGRQLLTLARTVPVYPYKPIFNLDFQLSKPLALSDAIALGCAARFNLSPVNIPGLMYDRRFQGYRRVLNGSLLFENKIRGSCFDTTILGYIYWDSSAGLTQD
jgi:hypothetical protein